MVSHVYFEIQRSSAVSRSLVNAISRVTGFHVPAVRLLDIQDLTWIFVCWFSFHRSDRDNALTTCKAISSRWVIEPCNFAASTPYVATKTSFCSVPRDLQVIHKMLVLEPQSSTGRKRWRAGFAAGSLGPPPSRSTRKHASRTPSPPRRTRRCANSTRRRWFADGWFFKK